MQWWCSKVGRSVVAAATGLATHDAMREHVGGAFALLDIIVGVARRAVKQSATTELSTK
jgi:hypothetical protein